MEVARLVEVEGQGHEVEVVAEQFGAGADVAGRRPAAAGPAGPATSAIIVVSRLGELGSHRLAERGEGRVGRDRVAADASSFSTCSSRRDLAPRVRRGRAGTPGRRRADRRTGTCGPRRCRGSARGIGGATAEGGAATLVGEQVLGHGPAFLLFADPAGLRHADVGEEDLALLGQAVQADDRPDLEAGQVEGPREAGR